VGDSDLLEATTIWQAARATSAAPSFFDELDITIGRLHESFVDGGTGANNPIHEIWDEGRNTWKGFTDDNINLMLSIGTGIPSMKPFGLTLATIGHTIATETEKSATHFRQDHTSLSRSNRYVRFNVDRGLEDVGLDEADRLGEIVSATKAYMHSEDVLDRTVFGNKMLEIEGRSSVRSISSTSGIEGRRVNQIEDNRDEL
jgi:predicted acylesterase/phospholipase RssA